MDLKDEHRMCNLKEPTITIKKFPTVLLYLIAEIVKYKEHNQIIPSVLQLTKGRTYYIIQNIIYGLCTEVSIVINMSIKYIDNLHVLFS